LRRNVPEMSMDSPLSERTNDKVSTTAPSRPPLGRRWAVTAVKLLIVLVVLAAVRHTLLSGLAQLDNYPWHFQPGWLIAAGALYLLGLLPAGLFWCHVVRTLGQPAGIGETLRAYFIGHLGKYVPGKAMVVVLRAGLIRSHRVNTAVAAASVFFETLTMMSVGALLSAAVLAVWFREQRTLFAVAVGLMVMAGLPTLPPVFKRLARIARVGKSDPATAANLQRLGYGTLLLGYVAMTIGWVLLGLSLWAVLKSMGMTPPSLVAELPRYTASVALAMVAGFLSLIPGGAVVREAILAQLMVPHFHDISPQISAPTAALVSALVLRLVWLVAELGISGILYVGGVRGRVES